MEGQRPGNGHPLLLSAGELVGVVVRPVGQTHLRQKLPAGLSNLLFALAASLLGQQFPGQGNVLQRCVLGKEVEVLEHQPEVEPLLADVLFRLGGGGRRVKDDIAFYGNSAVVRPLQKV